jgi:hypothetical protein
MQSLAPLAQLWPVRMEPNSTFCQRVRRFVVHDALAALKQLVKVLHTNSLGCHEPFSCYSAKTAWPKYK